MSFAAAHTPSNDFENLYTRLRSREGRVYSDEELALLPHIHQSHPHYKEWKIRRHSCRALTNYVKQHSSILSILEVGCGNGWFSARLAAAADVEVTGIDINSIELEQAARVFKKVAGLNFINGNLQCSQLVDKKFDLVVFAASIQYFPSLQQVISDALERLTLLGEIRILDSPFYTPQEMAAARQRTKEYYSRMGCMEMTSHYFHHSLAELEDFQYKILHHPHSWKNKLSIKKNPFYWISIKNKYS
jgi:ubiquinone/menaquinone biosynthesis C-methylase UbiE